MGIVTYFYFRAAKGRNAKTPWAIAHNPGGWHRSLTLRGWNWNREVYQRSMTAEENEIASESKRHYGGRYESLEKLLEDEQEILGADSEAYSKLETALRKYEGERIMPTTRSVKKGQGMRKILPLKNETMTTKAKTTKKKVNLVENKSKDVFVHLERDLIVPSTTNPRKRIDTDGIAELADSIGRVGILEPILVRRIGGSGTDAGFEIIAGERRWRASEIAKLETIPAIIKNVSDEEVLEIQIIENLQRRDVHPIDEADGYENLQKRLNWTEEEIALRVGKSVGYITNRLKLKNLTDQPRKLFEKNLLTLSHALEIVKYPSDAQEEITSYAFNNFGYESQTLFPLGKFIEKIQKNYLLQLKKASFSTKSNELRPDGLACVNCPERTNANPLLFEENYSDKDCCLNRHCWDGKTQTHIQIQRRKIVETDLEITEPEKIEKKAAKVPLITNDWYLRDDEKPTNGETVFKKDEDYKLLKKKDECKSAMRGVFFNGDRVGQSAWICKNKKCETHFRQSSGVANATHNSGEALKIRKEEIFTAKVAESTRRRTLKRIAEKFDAENTLYNHKNADGYQLELLTRLWKLQCSYSDHTAKIIVEILGLENQLNTSRWGEDFREQIIELSEDVRSKLLFLLLIADKCEIFESYWSYKSQREIKELAKDFGVDYQLLDAEERLGIIPNKFKDEFRAYLQEIESGNRDKKPPFAYSADYKAED
jgi:ParB family transcriptional regulator, chromosome partitioning protein